MLPKFIKKLFGPICTTIRNIKISNERIKRIEIEYSKTEEQRDLEFLEKSQYSIAKITTDYKLERFAFSVSAQNKLDYFIENTKVDHLFDKIVVFSINRRQDFELLVQELRPILYAQYAQVWGHENFGQGVPAQIWFLTSNNKVVIRLAEKQIINSSDHVVSGVYDFIGENSYELLENLTKHYRDTTLKYRPKQS